jgi:hypothetical protein
MPSTKHQTHVADKKFPAFDPSRPGRSFADETGMYNSMQRLSCLQILTIETQEMVRDLNALNLSAPESYMTQAVREALAAPLPRKEPRLITFPLFL